MAKTTVVPYQNQAGSKKEQVANMFNSISKKYDLLNHLLSLGIDIIWRKKAIKLLKNKPTSHILDIATGTGDFAIEALALDPKKVIGVDISEGMLSMGREKIKRKGFENRIELQLGDSEKLLFEDNKFDAVIVSFGVRNFEDLERGLMDMYRVLKEGGTVLILEFSRPRRFPVKQIFNFYFQSILPIIGKFVSKDKAAYTYLPDSVAAFPDGIDFVNVLKRVGFKEARCKPLTFGVSSIYTGSK